MLEKYVNKEVTISGKDGKVWSGIVSDYLFPDENDSGHESIIIETSEGALIEFEETDMIGIEVSP